MRRAACVDKGFVFTAPKDEPVVCMEYLSLQCLDHASCMPRSVADNILDFAEKPWDNAYACPERHTTFTTIGEFWDSFRRNDDH